MAYYLLYFSLFKFVALLFFHRQFIKSLFFSIKEIYTISLMFFTVEAQALLLKRLPSLTNNC